MFFTGKDALLAEGIAEEAVLISPESLDGALFAADLVTVGDGGRLLTNALLMGGIGVLEGRSMGTVKFRKEDGGEIGASAL